jgi:hypothetical protein
MSFKFRELAAHFTLRQIMGTSPLSPKLLLCGFLLLQGCTDTSKQRIQTSPLPAFKHAQAYWVDDDKVLFIGHDQSVSSPKLNLYVWDLPTSAVTTVSENMTGVLCFNRGYVVYGKPTSQYLFAGPLHNPQEESVHRGGLDSRLTCKPLPGGTRRVYESNNPQRYLVQLREEHGVLELPLGKDGIAYLHVPNKAEPIPVPSLSYEKAIFIKSGMQFHSYLGAYLITGYDNQRIRWLFPDGRVLELPIPLGPWRANQWNSAYLPVKDSVIAFDWETKGKGNIVLHGIYIIKNGSHVNVLPRNHSIANHSVSPNGCRVAFNYWKREGDEPNRIGVIDVCASN